MSAGYYWELSGVLPGDISLHAPHEGPVDLIHIFVKEKAALEGQLERLKGQIALDGMVLGFLAR